MAEKVVAQKLTPDDAASVVGQKKGKSAGGRGMTGTFRRERDIWVTVMAAKKVTTAEIPRAPAQATDQARARVA